ncbi:bifunctional DNA primase/polymerase [Streptomyces sp. NPDC093065]|uniref:bifunctional DNA primase/polymerase n=1 Tax=Streptomyces sp. NPDC093065 TaxID=3366021 RepID=UPI0038055B26
MPVELQFSSAAQRTLPSLSLQPLRPLPQPGRAPAEAGPSTPLRQAVRHQLRTAATAVAVHTPSNCPCLRIGRWCHSFHAATLNQGSIQQWWGQHPEFGTGVSCGLASLVVIDIDAHGTEP